MTSDNDQSDFFVGYLNQVPSRLRRFAIVAGLFWIAALAVLSFVLVTPTLDPGHGQYLDLADGTTFTGVVEARPYPVLRIPATAQKPAHRMMLAGEGKQGLQDWANRMEGQSVTLSGAVLKRGDLDMLLVADPPLANPDARTSTAATMPIPRGRWRLEGEICDGKCYAGAMNPGTGLAHKACANLCLEGGLPPVFVTRLPVSGSTFFLMADAEGGPLARSILDHTGQPIELEGVIEIWDDMPVLNVSAGSLKPVP